MILERIHVDQAGALLGTLGSVIFFTSSEISAANRHPAFVHVEKEQDVTSAIIDGAGKEIGMVRIIDGNSGVLLQIEVSELPPGAHGMHFHEVAECSGDAFASAGEMLGHHRGVMRMASLT